LNRFSHFIALGLLALALLAGASARASSSFDVETITELYHITADRTLLHTREKVKEAFGHVVVSAEGKRLAADYLWVDDTTKEIKARGNVVFVDKQTTVEAAELHFNMNTGFGAIFYGRVYDDSYQLRGQLIRRVGDGHYLTTEGEYSTCRDCPESWKLAARNVDLTVEGYAFMDGVFLKIKDIPTLYLPYLVVPVKRKRQSGLLFPRIGGSSSHGFVYVQPLFLAIDKHQDATISGGIYSDQGPRYELQYRYKSYNGITGQVDGYLSRDRKYPGPQSRGALKTENTWPFSRHFDVRWRFNTVSDRDYTYDFPEDVNFQGLPAVESNAVAQAPFDDVFLSVEARRYYNLLSNANTFDAGMVQDMPVVHGGIKERQLAGPLLGNLYVRFDNFTRHNGPFFDANSNGRWDPNFDYDPTKDDLSKKNAERLREAKRTILAPELSAPFSVGRYLSLTPALQYTSLHYDFNLPAPNVVPGTTTSYLRAHLDASTVFERVYDWNSEKISKIKHQLTPFVSYSYIPKVNADEAHDFQKQIKITDGPFDQFDVVPLTNSTNFLRFPQGKSIYFGFSSRLVRKKKRDDEIPRAYPYDLIPASKPKAYATPYNRKQEIAIESEKAWDKYNPRYDLYQEVWTFSASQAYDFLEAAAQRHIHEVDPSKQADNKRAFSYLLAKSDLNIDDQFSNHTEYKYYPALVTRPETAVTDVVYHDQQYFTTSLTWYWQRHANLRRTHFFERSISLGWTLNDQPNPARNIGGTLTWSFNDFFSLRFKESFDLNAKQQTGWEANAVVTHPSECWGLGFHWDWNSSRRPNMGEVGFQVLLNLDGSGFRGHGGGAQGGSIFGGS
jgi:lipopolysaccharide assembly outer membrane protein LptD (OstA)